MAGIWFWSFMMVCICLLFSKNRESFHGHIMAALGFPVEVFQLLAMRGGKACTHTRFLEIRLQWLRTGYVRREK